MKFDVLTPDAAVKLLQPYDFNFSDEVFRPVGNVLVFPEAVSRGGDLQVSQLIPVGVDEVCCVIVQGDLRIQGTISNYIHQNGSRQHGTNLVVLGNLEARSLISTNATVFVTQNLNLSQAAYLYYDNGTSELRVDGTLRAEGLIVNDEHRTRIENLEVEHDLDLYNSSFEEVEAAIRPEYLGDEDERVNHAALVAGLERGDGIFVGGGSSL
jgi:hypothetical protein